jgi:hypothetical protein
MNDWWGLQKKLLRSSVYLILQNPHKQQIDVNYFYAALVI